MALRLLTCPAHKAERNLLCLSFESDLRRRRGTDALLARVRLRANEQHQHDTDQQEREDRGHADALVAGLLRQERDGERCKERRHLSGESEQAEVLRDLSRWRQAGEQRAAGGLNGCCDEADENGEGEEDLLALRRERF